MTAGPVQPLPDAPPLDAPCVAVQDWTPVVFLHWRLSPDVAAPHMPDGVAVDTWDGCTFATLALTGIRRTRIGGVAPLPVAGSLLQVNTRLYSVDEAGRHGVVFVRLDGSDPVAAALARGGGQPYWWSDIDPGLGFDDWRVSPRHWRGPAAGGLAVAVQGEVGPAVQRDPLEHWLTNRWGAHARVGPTTVWMRVEHRPWRFRAFELDHAETTTFASVGLPVTGPPDLRAMWSPGVRARVGLPMPIAGRYGRSVSGSVSSAA